VPRRPVPVTVDVEPGAATVARAMTGAAPVLAPGTLAEPVLVGALVGLLALGPPAGTPTTGTEDAPGYLAALRESSTFGAGDEPTGVPGLAVPVEVATGVGVAVDETGVGV